MGCGRRHGIGGPSKCEREQGFDSNTLIPTVALLHLWRERDKVLGMHVATNDATCELRTPTPLCTAVTDMPPLPTRVNSPPSKR